MTPELEKQIASIIEAARQTGGDISSFIATQAPDAIQQMLVWKTTQTTGLAIFSFFFTILFFWLGRRVSKSRDGELCAIPYLMSIVSFIAMVVSIFYIVKIQIAPKLIILDYIKQSLHK